MLDVCLRRQLIASEAHDRDKELLDRIVAMLVKLCLALPLGWPSPHPAPQPHPSLVPARWGPVRVTLGHLLPAMK